MVAKAVACLNFFYSSLDILYGHWQMSIFEGINEGISANAYDPCYSGVVDSVYGELVERYKQQGAPVEVDFRELVNWVKIGDQLTHQIHPYPAKLLPNIAHFFSRVSSTSTSKIILDPFSGSGTVALEASLSGWQSYVSDSNPFALLLTKVKTSAYDVKQLYASLDGIQSRALVIREAPSVPVVNEKIWYYEETKKKLEILLCAVSSVEDRDLRDFFYVCFSSVAKRLSLADPSISVPVRLKEKKSFSEDRNKRIRSKLRWIKDTDPMDDFLRVCKSNIQRVDDTNNVALKRKAAVPVGEDARNLSDPFDNGESLPSNSIPLIISSPPYGSAQKYIRASSISLNWLGMATPNKLASFESKSIGREHVPKFRLSSSDCVIPSEYECFCDEVGKVNPLRAKITYIYLVELKEALVEMARVLCPGGRAAIVIGNNTVCGRSLRNDVYVKQVMLQAGLEIEAILVDDIKSRGLMTKRNKTASVISRESVLVFTKKSCSYG